MGLRTRLALAFVATSVVTLIVAVAALVPPLEHRLVHDRLHAMRELAQTAGVGLARLPARDLGPGAARPRAIVRELAREMGGRVALYDARGIELADTDPEAPDPGSGRPERFVDAGFARTGNVLDQVRGNQAVVVTRVRTRGGPRTLVLRKTLNDARAAAAVVRGALPVALGAALALAAAFGVALGFRLLRRLERLRLGARRLAEEGVQQPLELDPGGDEVAEVAHALETMRARLHAEEQGRQAFLSTASHELRTPLASLQGTIELLEEGLAREHPDLDRVRGRAAAAHRQTHRLTALAADLLDLGRLDADVALEAEPVELAELAGTIAGELEARAAAAGMTVRVQAPAPVWARADTPAAARIIRALLDNALRHAAAAGGAVDVVVAVEAAGNRALVSVRDDGPGVDEAERERIFGRFERGSSAGLGFGLGLPIARGLARRMGGDVRAARAPRGACFVVTLPACAAPVVSPDARGAPEGVPPTLSRS